eukprot:g59551.t1
MSCCCNGHAAIFSASMSDEKAEVVLEVAEIAKPYKLELEVGQRLVFQSQKDASAPVEKKETAGATLQEIVPAPLRKQYVSLLEQRQIERERNLGQVLGGHRRFVMGKVDEFNFKAKEKLREYSIYVGVTVSLALVIAVARSDLSRKLTNANVIIPKKGLTGRAGAFDAETGVFHFYHRPLLRRLLNPTFSSGNLRLFEDTIPLRLTGLRVDRSPAAVARVRELLEDKNVGVDLLERHTRYKVSDKEYFLDPVSCIIFLSPKDWKSVLFFWRGEENLGQVLLEEGHASCHGLGVFSKNCLSTKQLKKLEEAENRARAQRKGIWEGIPVPLSEQVVNTIRANAVPASLSLVRHTLGLVRFTGGALYRLLADQVSSWRTQAANADKAAKEEADKTSTDKNKKPSLNQQQRVNLSVREPLSEASMEDLRALHKAVEDGNVEMVQQLVKQVRITTATA